jgi:hypothetical protein
MNWKRWTYAVITEELKFVGVFVATRIDGVNGLGWKVDRFLDPGRCLFATLPKEIENDDEVFGLMDLYWRPLCDSSAKPILGYELLRKHDEECIENDALLAEARDVIKKTAQGSADARDAAQSLAIKAELIEA